MSARKRKCPTPEKRRYKAYAEALRALRRGRIMSHDDLIARCRKALEGVTEGPWEFDGGVVWRIAVRAVPDPRDETGQTPMPEYSQEKVCDTNPETAAFIAASRTLLPELVDALETAQAENERLQEESFQRSLAIDLGEYGTWDLIALTKLFSHIGIQPDDDLKSAVERVTGQPL